MALYEDISFPMLPDRPYTIINMVTTVDGKAVAPDDKHPLFGGAADRPAMVELRAHCDALLYGATTGKHVKPAEFLNPKFQARRQELGLKPLMTYVLFSEHGSLADSDVIFSSPDFTPIVYVPQKTRLTLKNADVRHCGKGSVDVGAALQELKAKDGISSLNCEGGPTTNQPLLANGLVDEFFVTVRPVIFGGKPIRTIVEGELLPPERGQLELVSAEPAKTSEVFLRYRVKTRLQN